MPARPTVFVPPSHRFPPALIRPPRERDPAYNEQPIAPLFLYGSTQLVAGTSDAPSPAAFMNPTGQDMEILEIRFELSGVNPGISSAVPFGGTISCQLAYGAYKLTQGAVPVWGFGRAENLEGENKNDGVNRAFCAYSWRLPRPLFIPAGAVVAPSFVHTGYIQQAINVRVGYSARVAVERPSRVYLPWVASYTSKAFNPIETAATDESTQMQLVNATPDLLHLQRFTGRTLYISPAGSTSEALPESFGSQNLTMRMVDSYGRPIVRSYTPFRSVFSPLTRSWELEELGACLDPGAYYRVFLKNAASVVANAGAQAQAFVSMVGWREVSA